MTLIDELAVCRTCNKIIFYMDKICPFCHTPIDMLADTHKEALK